MVCALAVLSAGCSKSGLSAGQTTCSYGGKTYRSGATFASSDGCNRCACSASGEVDCTLMACLGDAGYLPPAGDAATAAPDSWVVPDTFRPGEEVKPDVGTFADTKPGPDVASDAKPLADASSDTNPGTDGLAVSDAGDSAKDSGLTCILPDGGPGQFDCYVCTCRGDQAWCDFVGCPVDAGKDPCTLPTEVTFGATGGMVTYEDQYRLDPTSGLTITRNYNGRGASSMDGATVRSCTPTMPACGASSVVSVSTIVSDLAAADVRSAFALGTTPIFGMDERPVDGPIWSIALASGGAVLVGGPCPSPTMNSCWPTPAGVQKLADDLKSLAAAMAAQSACAGL
jgi:hypothetical protein